MSEEKSERRGTFVVVGRKFGAHNYDRQQSGRDSTYVSTENLVTRDPTGMYNAVPIKCSCLGIIVLDRNRGTE